MSPTTAPVQRRRVHHVAGFDPRGAAHHHRLCRTEAAKPQPQGGALRVGWRETITPVLSRWSVAWRPVATTAANAVGPDEPIVRTEHVFMGWHDIVRSRWTRRSGALALEFIRTYAHLIRRVGAARVWRLSRSAFITGALPLAVLVVPLAWTAGLAAVWGVPAALAGGLLALVLWWQAAQRGLRWLLRTLGFFAHLGHAPLADIDARCRSWVDDIVARQQADPVDEVLIVGHSAGALLLVPMVDALLADPRWQALQGGRPTALLTLGQCFPVVALAPGAGAMRAALQRLSHHPALCWWDVTARIDPLCFHQRHPLAGTGLPHGDAPWPVRHAARFMPMYAPATWKRLRGQKLRAHFLYFHTAERSGNFALLDVLYGPRPLAQQIADRGAPQHG